MGLFRKVRTRRRRWRCGSNRMSGDKKSAGPSGPKGGKSQQEIVATFQKMRENQRNLASKISELEVDIREHETVIEALKEVAADRKCFQLIGGVLTEKTAGDVVPNLINKKTQINGVTEHLHKELEKAGQELIKYKEEHNIQIRGEQPPKKDKNLEDQSNKSGILAGK